MRWPAAHRRVRGTHDRLGRTLGIVCVALALAACAPVVNGPRQTVDADVTAAPVAATGGRAVLPDQKEVQALLDEFASAIGSGDRAGLERLYDPSRGAFRTCRLQILRSALEARAQLPSYRVIGVEPYGDIYVRAKVEASGVVARLYASRYQGKAVFTEPRETELGELRRKRESGIELVYWEIDEDVSDVLLREAVAAREFAVGFAPKPIRVTFSMRVFPTRETGASAACEFAGMVYLLNPDRPEIRLYQVSFAPGLTQLSDSTRTLLRHETLHWLQDQMVLGAIQSGAWWLVEGWPEYQIGRDPTSTFTRHGCVSDPPSLTQLVLGPTSQPDRSADQVSRYYAYANSLVRFVHDLHGPAVYWRLLESSTSSRRNEEEVFPQILGIGPDQFHGQWKEWARKQYCR